MTTRATIGIGVAVVCAVLTLAFSSMLFENVDSGEIMVLQDPVDGDLHVFASAGLRWQGFGKVTKYNKSETLHFSSENGECTKDGTAIKTRFNDGANGWVCGSLRYELPTDEKSVLDIHRIFGNQDSLEAKLVQPVLQKSVYMSGPLMSSAESYAERRTDLIQFIKDQTEQGVYQTRTETKRVSVDALGLDVADSGSKKTVEVAVIAKGTDGQPLRQEISPLTRFNVRVYNFAIIGILYDDRVEQQIDNQQQETMEVQTAIARAKKEEQRLRTERAKGQAEAEKAKWEQEVSKAKAVTKAEQEKAVAVLAAEQKREVATLNRDAAKLEKERNILLGQGEAQRKRLVMEADGALTAKLTAWKEVNFRYADQMGKQRWVPEVVMGGGNGSTNSAQGLLDMFMAKTARDLALDLSMRGQK